MSAVFPFDVWYDVGRTFKSWASDKKSSAFQGDIKDDHNRKLAMNLMDVFIAQSCFCFDNKIL